VKLKILLSDVDSKRLDLPDELDLDPATVSFREVVALQRGWTVEGELIAYDSPDEWRAAWLGRPAVGRDGQPVMEDQIDPDTGEPVYDEAGDPVRVAKRVGDWGAALVAVWLAARRARREVAFADVADCDPERTHLSLVPDESDDVGPGKGQGTAETTS
jgi:hypothetical protein